VGEHIGTLLVQKLGWDLRQEDLSEGYSNAVSEGSKRPSSWRHTPSRVREHPGLRRTAASVVSLIVSTFRPLRRKREVDTSVPLDPTDSLRQLHTTTMRFLHLADVHLDTPFAGRSDGVRRRLQEASREALRRAVSCALAERVHAVLLAGDLFDGERLSFQTERFLLEELARLAEADIPVVYATGNHDPGQDAHRTRPLAWPPNVRLIGETNPQLVRIQDPDGEEVGVVTAAGHASRRETGDLAATFPSVARDGLPQVALLHTQVRESRGTEEHEPYAPSDLRHLLSSGYDYWALGHVHLRQCLSEAPGVHYPGNLQGRTHKESGPKGGLLVELAPEAPAAVKFRSFAPVRFETITVGGLEEADTLDKLLAQIETTWQEERQADPGEEGTEWVVRFNVTGGSPSWKRLCDEEERVTLAHETAEELGLLDAEIQAGPLHPVVRVEDHLGRTDVLGTALRLLEDLRRGHTVLGLPVEGLAGLDHPDAMDPVAYVQSLLEGAEGELIARMLERGTGE
jgi:exonuclease SbcD